MRYGTVLRQARALGRKKKDGKKGRGEAPPGQGAQGRRGRLRPRPDLAGTPALLQQAACPIMSSQAVSQGPRRRCTLKPERRIELPKHCREGLAGMPGELAAAVPGVSPPEPVRFRTHSGMGRSRTGLFSLHFVPLRGVRFGEGLRSASRAPSYHPRGPHTFLTIFPASHI